MQPEAPDAVSSREFDVPPHALVVDDEPSVLRTMEAALRTFGYTVDAFSRPQDALAALSPGRYDLALVDLMMRPMDGMAVLARLRERSPETSVVIVTAHGSIESAVEAVKQGAFHYLEKPFELDELQLVAERALEHGRLRREVAALRARLAGVHAHGRIITDDPVLRETLDLAVSVADSLLPVLIVGESGTGKELVASLVHERSARRRGPFVKVNCAALPESLLESELFGHVRGAFTGALQDRTGRFEAAHGGTLFLDEIAEVPTSVQVKLLRVLQSKEFERVGESTTRRVDVRVVAATNTDLEAALREGRFRGDLYYRLNGVRLRLPPLRERPGDVGLLVEHFAVRAAERNGVEPPEMDRMVLQALGAHPWPGNVRELENVVERAVVLARGGTVTLGQLPEEMRAPAEEDTGLVSLEEVERRHIGRVLAAAKDYEEAARTLGIDPATLWRKRKRYGLE